MTSLRVLAIASGALGLGIVGAGLVGGRSGGHADRAPRAVTAAAFTGPSTSTSTATSTKTTVGPAKAPDLRNVPPSILSRAADARALDRAAGAACRSPARSDATICAPQRDSVEIHWDVGKDP